MLRNLRFEANLTLALLLVHSALVLHLNQKVHTAFTLKIEEENYKRSRRNMLCVSVLQYCEVNNDQQDEMS